MSDIKPILIDLPMPIETPRLIIRSPAQGDGAALAEAVDETWDDLHRWMAFAADKAESTPEKYEIFVREQMANFIRRDQLLFMQGFEKSTGRLVLSTGLNKLNWKAGSFMIGYWVRKSAQGQGYATEGTNALLRYAFKALSAKRVWIMHADGNELSRRVIEKLGFVKEGVARLGHQLPDGALADELRYARLDLDGLPPLDVKWGPP